MTGARDLPAGRPRRPLLPDRQGRGRDRPRAFVGTAVCPRPARPGRYFGETALLSKRPRGLMARCAMPETDVITLGRDDFATLAGTWPQFADTLRATSDQRVELPPHRPVRAARRTPVCSGSGRGRAVCRLPCPSRLGRRNRPQSRFAQSWPQCRQQHRCPGPGGVTPTRSSNGKARSTGSKTWARPTAPMSTASASRSASGCIRATRSRLWYGVFFAAGAVAPPGQTPGEGAESDRLHMPLPVSWHKRC